jgi:uncharacterized repeat protein (TIGR03803 family)
MDPANGRPARPGPSGPGRVADDAAVRRGRRRFRPSVVALEGRQLLSGAAAGHAEATLATFGGTQQAIVGGLVMDAQGNLYGTAAGAGRAAGKGDGTVFEIAQGTGKVTTLATFDGPKGDGLSGLSIDNRGNLYGAIGQDGGAGDEGTVFEIAHGSGKVTTLASFDGANGRFPGGVVADAQGNLYGTAAAGWTGGATAFEIAKGSGRVATLAAFTGAGAAPKGVVMDGQGNLYGTDQDGGPKGAAAVFEIARGSGQVTTLASFGGLIGSGVSAVTADGQGNLYGTTEDGGTYGDGSVFEIARGSGTVTTLASFNGDGGTVPDASVGVKLDAQGNLYGVTAFGGTNGEGTLFEVARGSGTVTTLASFAGINGATVGDLMMDGAGTFYGTTDGSGRGGTVFRLTLADPAAAVATAVDASRRPASPRPAGA